VSNEKTLRTSGFYTSNCIPSVYPFLLARVSSESTIGRVLSDDKTMRSKANHTTSLRIGHEKI